MADSFSLSDDQPSVIDEDLETFDDDDFGSFFSGFQSLPRLTRDTIPRIRSCRPLERKFFPIPKRGDTRNWRFSACRTRNRRPSSFRASSCNTGSWHLHRGTKCPRDSHLEPGSKHVTTGANCSLFAVSYAFIRVDPKLLAPSWHVSSDDCQVLVKIFNGMRCMLRRSGGCVGRNISVVGY